MRKARRDPLRETPRRKRRRARLLLLVVCLITLAAALLATAIFLLPRMGTRAANSPANQNCTLIVPDQPLTAQGLATPYQLTATDAAQGPCNEANTAQSAFVQGVIYDPSAGTFSVYNPLIIDQGMQPALTPAVPTLPQGAIVGLWFGFDANSLLLHGARRTTLAQAHCVNGLGDSLFGQYAYCNAVAFFAAVNQGIVAGRVHVPALGTAKDGQLCPTVRDFSMVDQDQSDNVQTQYLALPDGQTAQFSAANQTALQPAFVLDNPSDNALLTRFIDPALGCTEWEAPNLADHGSPVAALALDELQAAMHQRAPIALIPLNDPMTTVAVGKNNDPSLAKTDLYRLGVDQIPAVNTQQASATTYCADLLQTGMPRLVRDKPLTVRAQTPDAGVATTLFTFLAQRLQTSYTNLNCAMLLSIPNPVKTKTDANGVVISATFNLQATGDPIPRASAPNCRITGQLVNGCMGTATISGQTCTLSLANNTVTLTCPLKHK